MLSVLKIHFIKGLKGGVLQIPTLTTQYKLMKLFLFLQNDAISHMDNLLQLDITSLSYCSKLFGILAYHICIILNTEKASG